MYALFLEQVAQKQVSLKTYDIEISEKSFFFGENVEGISIGVSPFVFFSLPIATNSLPRPGETAMWWLLQYGIRQTCSDVINTAFLGGIRDLNPLQNFDSNSFYLTSIKINKSLFWTLVIFEWFFFKLFFWGGHLSFFALLQSPRDFGEKWKKVEESVAGKKTTTRWDFYRNRLFKRPFQQQRNTTKCDNTLLVGLF